MRISLRLKIEEGKRAKEFKKRVLVGGNLGITHAEEKYALENECIALAKVQREMNEILNNVSKLCTKIFVAEPGFVMEGEKFPGWYWGSKTTDEELYEFKWKAIRIGDRLYSKEEGYKFKED